MPARAQEATPTDHPDEEACESRRVARQRSLSYMKTLDKPLILLV